MVSMPDSRPNGCVFFQSEARVLTAVSVSHLAPLASGSGEGGIPYRIATVRSMYSKPVYVWRQVHASVIAVHVHVLLQTYPVIICS